MLVFYDVLFVSKNFQITLFVGIIADFVDGLYAVILERVVRTKSL